MARRRRPRPPNPPNRAPTRRVRKPPVADPLASPSRIFLQKYRKLGFHEDDARLLASLAEAGQPVEDDLFAEARDPKSGRISSAWWLGRVIERRVRDLHAAITAAHAQRLVQRLSAPGVKPSEWEWMVGGLVRRLRDLLADLIPHKPSLTREEFLAFVEAAWPATRGARAKGTRLFDPFLVAVAIQARSREEPSWKVEAVLQDVADRLSTSARTLRAVSSRARRRS